MAPAASPSGPGSCRVGGRAGSRLHRVATLYG